MGCSSSAFCGLCCCGSAVGAGDAAISAGLFVVVPLLVS